MKLEINSREIQKIYKQMATKEYTFKDPCIIEHNSGSFLNPRIEKNENITYKNLCNTMTAVL
jgi:hypothetical protein